MEIERETGGGDPGEGIGPTPTPRSTKNDDDDVRFSFGKKYRKFVTNFQGEPMNFMKTSTIFLRPGRFR